MHMKNFLTLILSGNALTWNGNLRFSCTWSRLKPVPLRKGNSFWVMLQKLGFRPQEARKRQNMGVSLHCGAVHNQACSKSQRLKMILLLGSLKRSHLRVPLASLQNDRAWTEEKQLCSYVCTAAACFILKKSVLVKLIKYPYCHSFP